MKIYVYTCTYKKPAQVSYFRHVLNGICNWTLTSVLQQEAFTLTVLPSQIVQFAVYL